MSSLRVLVVGDVVGQPGMAALTQLATLRQQLTLDLIIINGENAAPTGNGLPASAAHRIFASGANVITLGDHWFRCSDLLTILPNEPRLLRPANYPRAAAGHGAVRYRCGQLEIGIIVVQGRVFMSELVDCPFAAVDRELLALQGCDVLLVEIHAEATSEKAALAHYLAGRVAAVWGTHTHVPTADERLLADGTAFITDIGMTGAHDGIIGREPRPVLTKMVQGMPAPFHVARGDIRLNGAWFEIETTPDTMSRGGRATRIERVTARLR